MGWVVLTIFCLGIGAAAVVQGDCVEIISGRRARMPRRVRPRVESLEGRIVYALTSHGAIPDEAVVFLLDRVGSVAPGLDSTPSYGPGCVIIAGIPCAELEDGFYVPAGYVPVLHGGFVRFSNFDSSLPDTIPLEGLTAADIIALKKPKPVVRPPGRPPTPGGPLRRKPPTPLNLIPQSEEKNQTPNQIYQIRAPAKAHLKPPEHFWMIDLRAAEAKWGAAEFTIEKFRNGLPEERAAMVVSLVRQGGYRNREIERVLNDLGPGDGFFIHPLVPAYALSTDEQVVFIPDDSGVRVGAVKILKGGLLRSEPEFDGFK